MQPSHYFTFARGKLQRLLPVTRVHRVLTQELITQGLRQRHFVPGAKFHGAPGPYVAVSKTSQVLISAGEKAEDEGHGRGSEASDLLFDRRCCQCRCSLEERNGFVMLAGQMIKPSFHRQRIRRCYRVRFRIEHQ